MPGIDWFHSSAGQMATYAALITFSLWSPGYCIWSFSTELKQPCLISASEDQRGYGRMSSCVTEQLWVHSGGETFQNGIIFITVSISIQKFLTLPFLVWKSWDYSWSLFFRNCFIHLNEVLSSSPIVQSRKPQDVQQIGPKGPEVMLWKKLVPDISLQLQNHSVALV